VRDAAAAVPADYRPPAFQTRALQHTSVELTWDAGDEGRRRALTRKLTADELKEDDFRAYLASDSDEAPASSDDDEGGGGGRGADAVGAGGDAKERGKQESADAIRERYRRLLLGGGGGGEGEGGGGDGAAPSERRGTKDWGGGGGGAGDGSDSDDKDGGEDAGGEAADRRMEMEVTFVPGLEGLGERLLAKKRDAKAKAGETGWDAYLRRKREKKAAARRLGKTNVGSDSGDSGSDPEEE
jgi:hypothetical protein